MKYEIRVDFDDCTFDLIKSRGYYQFLDRYKALGIGHERTRTSSILVSSEEPLNREQLAKDLENIKIISVNRFA